MNLKIFFVQIYYFVSYDQPTEGVMSACITNILPLDTPLNDLSVFPDRLHCFNKKKKEERNGQQATASLEGFVISTRNDMKSTLETSENFPSFSSLFRT